MSQKNCKQTLFETLNNEGIVTESLKVRYIIFFSNQFIFITRWPSIFFPQNFRHFLRIKDGNEDEPETEIGEDFEILLQFVLDSRQLPGAQMVEKYFVSDSTLSLSNNAIRKELKSGSQDPQKLKTAEEDVKNVIITYFLAIIFFIHFL